MLKSPERIHVATVSTCGIVGREENRETTHTAQANAAPQKVKATVATSLREKLFPNRPLIAAPASGSSGMIQRWRSGVMI